MPLTWMSQRVDASRHTWLGLATHMEESFHTCEWVMCHTHERAHAQAVIPLHEHLLETEPNAGERSFEMDITSLEKHLLPCLCHTTLCNKFGQKLLCGVVMCAIFGTKSRVPSILAIRDTIHSWVIHIGDTTHSCAWHDWLMLYDMAHSPMRLDRFLSDMTWPFYTWCDMTYSYA